MRGGRILLTGATGRIVSRLLRTLEAGGCTVRRLASACTRGGQVRLLQVACAYRRVWFEFARLPGSSAWRRTIPGRSSATPAGSLDGPQRVAQFADVYRTDRFDHVYFGVPRDAARENS
jgi:hypothetical protein